MKYILKFLLKDLLIYIGAIALIITAFIIGNIVYTSVLLYNIIWSFKIVTKIKYMKWSSFIIEVIDIKYLIRIIKGMIAE